MAKETKPQATALAVIDPKGYAVMDDDTGNIGEVMAENLAGEEIDEFDLLQVKVPSGGATVWSVPNTSGSEDNADTIDGIILHVGKRRQFWADKDPSGNPPDCSSRDMITGVGNPGGPCEKCPKNEFGSAANGHGKACKETRALFLVRQGDHLPIVISVSPASLSHFKKYILGLKVPYSGVVTRLSLGKTKNADGIQYSEIKFQSIGLLPQEAIDKLKKYGAALKAVVSSGPALTAPKNDSAPALPAPQS